MAASIVIEEERGIYRGSRHPHNGYYAGDFAASRSRDASLQALALRLAITTTIR